MLFRSNFGRDYEDWWIDPKEIEIVIPDFFGKSSQEFSELWVGERSILHCKN